MVTSVHVADVGAARALRFMRKNPRADGLRWAAATTAVPLSASLMPSPKPGRIGLIAAWESDEALNTFLADHPAAAVLASGYAVRLHPVRLVGDWPELGPLPDASPHIDGPVAALTLGYLKFRRVGAFLRASTKAEAAAIASGAVIRSTALVRPPHLVATFSVWRDLPSMRDYVEGGGHHAALAAHGRRPFHHQSAFIRCRPEVITEPAT